LEVFELPKPISIGGWTVEWFNVKNYAFDPAMAPSGKSLLLSMFLCEWSHWRSSKAIQRHIRLRRSEPPRHASEPWETHYPGIRNKVEMVDVATPLTYERYTGNWKGPI